jgi:hypothetical protein
MSFDQNLNAQLREENFTEPGTLYIDDEDGVYPWSRWNHDGELHLQ